MFFTESMWSGKEYPRIVQSLGYVAQKFDMLTSLAFAL